MSTAHLFPSAEGLVVKGLRGLIAYNPGLSLDEANRVVFDSTYDRSKVVLVSGGGSGHEPAWSGYVGHNMLTAAVAGDIFASPSTKQIVAAIERCPSDQGTILVVTNYTGDCLHFGLAVEKALAAGHHNCRMIICGDDVSVGRDGGKRLVGRRGLAGQIAVLKVMGGAAGAGESFDYVYRVGTAFSRQIASIAATLDHCHVPGRDAEAHRLATDQNADALEIGTGPHNEPGYRKLQPAPGPEELVATLLRYCLDPKDVERAYVDFRPQDETVLLVSNFGGMSQLELSALVDELLVQLERDWHIEPVRVYAGCLETSLNAPAFSVSLVNVTGVARDPECPYTADKVLGFLDVPTNTHWASLAGYQTQSQRRKRREQVVRANGKEEKEKGRPNGHESVNKLQVDPERLKKALRVACDAVIAAEPDLTRWDTVLGDGDCGETLKAGALGLKAAVDQDGSADRGSVADILLAIEHVVEDKMGGTLGGILGIFLVALRTAVETATKSDDIKKNNISLVWAPALNTALDHLAHYTPAQVGDRTVIDTLQPLARGLAEGKTLEAGVKAAIAGAEATRAMQPKLGRASYTAAAKEEGPQDLPPDPGAWGVMVAIRGFYDGWQTSQ